MSLHSTLQRFGKGYWARAEPPEQRLEVEGP